VRSSASGINLNLPQPGSGFGRLSLPPISRQDLLNQRGRPVKDVNAWWQSRTPEQREQAIRGFPDLVGWLDGVPAEDRNQANGVAAQKPAGCRRLSRLGRWPTPLPRTLISAESDLSCADPRTR
jgi:hypothetical protein